MWMKIKLGLVVSFFLLAVMASGQFANEWIDYSQEYYKIAVAEDGFYRITSSELSAVGVPVENIAQNRYQLFRSGDEVAMLVNDTNNDGRLDYLEFYGEKRDGTSDTELYHSPDAQPHTYYNLFSDTAAYFLTWKRIDESGKRMAFSSFMDASGFSPEPHHRYEDLNLQISNYSAGLRHGSSRELLSALYDYGEGWTGSNFGKNAYRTFTFSLLNFDQSGPDPEIEVLLTGFNNLGHLVDINVGPSEAELRSIGQASFERQYTYRFNADIDWSDIGASGELVVKVTALGINGQAEQIAVSYVKCTYPQQLIYTGSFSQAFHFETSSSNRKYISLKTAFPSSRVFDVTFPKDPVRIATTSFSDKLEFVYLNPSVERDILVVSEVKPVPSIARIDMQELDPRNFNYLILTHESLNQAVDGINPVTAYEQYREGGSGGGYEVLVAYIDDVFNQFGFGDPGPLAIRNFVRYAVGGDAEYVFLIGKGTTVNHSYYRSDPSGTVLTHFIPTFGYPGSDVLFGVETGQLTPSLPVTRLNAYTSGDVKAYLDKVKEMKALPYNVLWRKNLVQLSGGQTPGEQRTFANYIEQFERVAEGDYLGGRATNINKEKSSTVEEIDIAKQVNEGVGLITFFGHSSANVTDIEIGRVSVNEHGYANQGRYPFFLVNGCNAGEIFANTFTFGEDWLHTPNLGAIGFVANSDFALSLSLKRYSDLFYEVAFADEQTFGSTAGNIQKEVASRYLNRYGSDHTALAQVYQTLYQGDPVVRIFGAQSPDYALDGEEVFTEAITGDRVLAHADSFRLMIPVRNFGKTVKDSLQVAVTRTLSDGTSLEYKQRFERVLYADTLAFTIWNNPEDQDHGTNTFVIRLDPGDSVAELSEANNASGFELYIPKGNTIHLFPIAFGTVNDPQVRLVWQSANLLERDRAYSLEVDTLPQFNSLFKKSTILTGDQVMEFSLDLSSLADSSTVFWRTRFDSPRSNEDTTWVESSFTVTSAETGWAQIDRFQLAETQSSGVTYEAEGQLWSFQETSTPIQVTTHGVSSNAGGHTVLIDEVDFLFSDAPLDPDCKKKNAINAVIFDKETSQPYRPFGLLGTDVFNDLVCGRAPQMIHNLDETDVLGANRYLDSLISTMKSGDMILLFSFDSVAYSNWDTRLKTSLAEVGIETNTINTLIDGQPVIFLGRKGDPPGSAIEGTANGSNLPVKDQTIELVGLVTGKFSSGSITSPRVGPAKAWSGFSYEVASDINDFFGFTIYGVTNGGVEDPVFTSDRATGIDLSQIDADIYPFLKINFSFSDEQDQTPPQLKSWGISYVFPPEGLLSVQDVSGAEVQEGQEYSRAFTFTNLSRIAFTDSLSVEYQVMNVSSGNRENHAFKIEAPAPGDTIEFTTSVQTRGKAGANNIFITVSANEQELYTVNNSINLVNALSVKPDETNPVLDVTFDGTYILDGDIVSPDPNIVIRFKDDNEYLYKEDTAGVAVSLKRPCDGCDYERVSFTEKLSFTPASEDQDFEIRYNPGPLEDGIYYLKVKGTDESGNQSGQEDYEISFEVINESAITHFYPYPNPFSTNTRFVFTLTGSMIPDQIIIQIMTVSGRVVREIDDIGPLRIGNNISQYAWDGRDEYGDLLANGLYLYKVFIKEGGETLKHRHTSADRAFKNGFGKLYILR